MADEPSLAGPLVRIDRADELLRHLDSEIQAFLQTKPCTAVQQHDPNPSNRAFLITHVADIPMRLRVLAGEAPHHLRASLDLLIYQLLRHEGVIEAKRLRACAFPTVVDRDLTKRPDKKKYDSYLKEKIGGVTDKAYRRIEALQPCQPGNPGKWSHLAQIQELDNTDKHRLLIAAMSSIQLKNFAHRDESRRCLTEKPKLGGRVWMGGTATAWHELFSVTDCCSATTIFPITWLPPSILFERIARATSAG